MHGSYTRAEPLAPSLEHLYSEACQKRVELAGIHPDQPIEGPLIAFLVAQHELRPWIEILSGTHRTSETSSEPSGSANPCLSAGVLGGSIRYGKTALDEPARVKSEWKSTA